MLLCICSNRKEYLLENLIDPVCVLVFYDWLWNPLRVSLIPLILNDFCSPTESKSGTVESRDHQGEEMGRPLKREVVAIEKRLLLVSKEDKTSLVLSFIFFVSFFLLCLVSEVVPRRFSCAQKRIKRCTSLLLWFSFDCKSCFVSFF